MLFFVKNEGSLSKRDLYTNFVKKKKRKGKSLLGSNSTLLHLQHSLILSASPPTELFTPPWFWFWLLWEFQKTYLKAVLMALEHTVKNAIASEMLFNTYVLYKQTQVIDVEKRLSQQECCTYARQLWPLVKQKWIALSR